jgi:membrane-bound lytic murein transglycosylase MltF
LTLFLSLSLESLQASREIRASIQSLESENTQSKPLLKKILKKDTGDLDAMLKKKTIRVLVVDSKAFYGIEKGKKYGLFHDAIVKLEKQINQNHPGKKHIKTKLVPIPVSREFLIPALLAGYGDMVMADSAITIRRKEQVAFTKPFASGIDEILVTHKSIGGIKRFEDLSGKEVFVRPSMSYLDSLLQVNKVLVLKGLAPIQIRALPEALESEDILELVDAGIIGMTIMDDYKAKMWSKAYKNIKLYPKLTFRTDSQLGLMLRKDNPLLLKELNAFVERNKVGKDFSLKMMKKYFSAGRYLKDLKTGISEARYEALRKKFAKYAKQYDLDPLMLMAQAYQESRFVANARSHAGARGIMQLMVGTAREMNVGSVNNPDANIHAGIKYHRLLRDRYFNDPKLSGADRTLFIFAGYNAGPNRINRLRKLAAKRGLDPNVWFDNVEIVAAEEIGRETVQYIENIYNHYVAYTLIDLEKEAKLRAKIDIFEDLDSSDVSDLGKKKQALQQKLAMLTGVRGS